MRARSRENPAPGALARPSVAMPPSRWPLIAFGLGLLFVSLLLFQTLEAKRQRVVTPALSTRALAQGAPAPVPELVLPSYSGGYAEPPPRSMAAPAATQIAHSLPPVIQSNPPASRRAVRTPTLPSQGLGRGLTAGAASPPPTYTPPPPANVLPPQPNPPLGTARRPTLGSAGAAASQSVSASIIGDPATTIVEGSLIHAVLETALDSTRGGKVRALVTRDIQGFDGTRVLIPRGSRLIGEYQSDVAPGQKRALVMWTRLLRPDGVSMALQSPAADAMGRAGVEGKVNTHFMERLGATLLRSSIDYGAMAAAQSIGNGAVVVVPQSVQNASEPLAQSMQIRPTLRVKPGTRIAVFVARDLDFSGVDAP